MPRLIPLALLALATTAPLTAATATAPTDHWQGTISLPGATLEFMVRFTPDPEAPGGWTAVLDIPAQGVQNAPMSAVVYTATELAFTFAQPGAVFRGAIATDGRTAAGTLAQAGQTFPATFTRLTADEAAAAAPRRPQTPQPPFPYTEHEVTYRNEGDGITIAGTLTIPAGAGPFAAVVLITGSGAQDRDHAIMGHQPFRVLADHLARHGIAVLRSDDRGVGGTTGRTTAATSEHFARDALAGLAHLAGVERIDPRRRGLIGHSEGGMVAAIAAAQSADVAFVVMLAGAGVPGDEILRQQTRLLLAAAGTPTAQIDTILVRHRNLTDAVIADLPQPAQIDAMKALLRAQGVGAPEPELTTTAERHLRGMQTPWFRFFLTFDPRPTLRQVRCPVLALNGSLDLQVPPAENLAAITQTLAEGGNQDVTVHELDGLNHLFQTATTGSVTEYATIEETFAPAALAIIADWIQGQS